MSFNSFQTTKEQKIQKSPDPSSFSDFVAFLGEVEKERKTVLTKKKPQQQLHSRRLLSIGIGLRAPLDQNKRIREFNYLVLPFSTKRQL